MMDMKDWRTEWELLLLSAQAPFESGKRARIESLLDGPVDWEYLIETSYAHAVTPLLCRTLGLVAPNLVPPDVAEAARANLEENRSRNNLMTQELLRILAGLAGAGIPAIPFKGPVLAEHYYGDPSLRRYADLDFLVAEDAAQETLGVLRTLGYTGSGQVSSKDKTFTLTPRQDAALWRYAGEYLFFHAEKPIAIEPHWAFVPPTFGLDLDYAKLWARARQGVLADSAILVLSREDTLLGLALHGAKSHWSRLQWISDLDRAMKCETDVDWEALLHEARQMGILRILLVGLQLARLLFGTELDAGVGAAMANDAGAEAVASERAATLFHENAPPASTSGISRDWLRMLDHNRQKLAYVFRTMVTPRVQHFEALPLPDWLFPAYYLFKPAHDYLALPLWLAAKKRGLVKGAP
ncbi:MAG: nucleotidyltransferase family protein [Alphaproteobacteria bacterium]